MTRALLIVDVQHDFTEGGALGCDGGAAVAAAITEHARVGDYALVVASRDWHHGDDDNGGHFANGEPDFVETWPVHCVAGTHGAEYHAALDTSLVDVHVRKGQGRPAYSAFEGETEDGRALADVLAEHGVDEIDVVGIATDYCVKASALDALPLVATVTVLDDLTAAVAPASRAVALTELAAAGVVVR